MRGRVELKEFYGGVWRGIGMNLIGFN